MKYTLSNLPARMIPEQVVDLVHLQLPCGVERDYQDLKQEIDLAPFEG